MSDKELVMQMLYREVDNIIARINNPLLFMFSDAAKMYVNQLLSPYIDAFVNKSNGELDSRMASEFAKSEVNTKIENFRKNFEDQKDI